MVEAVTISYILHMLCVIMLLYMMLQVLSKCEVKPRRKSNSVVAVAGTCIEQCAGPGFEPMKPVSQV